MGGGQFILFPHGGVSLWSVVSVVSVISVVSVEVKNDRLAQPSRNGDR